MQESFDAYVTAVAFDAAANALFALGDGSVRAAGGPTVQAHDGAVLAAVLHPSGQGLITGGDDGRLVWTRDGESQALASLPGRWIDSVAASPASGLIAFAAGRDLHVRDAGDPGFARTFAHERLDWRRHHLRRPPRGYEWREVDGNYVLAAAASRRGARSPCGGRCHSGRCRDGRRAAPGRRRRRSAPSGPPPRPSGCVSSDVLFPG
jgi:hypothetical protein